MTYSPVQGSAAIVVQPTKSVGLAVFLAALFGPIGMFYSTVLGGLLMFLPYLIVVLFTLGFGIILMAPICMLWSGLAANSFNKKLINRLGEGQGVRA